MLTTAILLINFSILYKKLLPLQRKQKGHEEDKSGSSFFWQNTNMNPAFSIMKKLFLMGAMLVCGLVANAQMSITPQVGATLATLTGVDDAKMKIGLVAGANVEYPVADAFSVSGGLLYSMQGYKYDGAGGDFNVNMNYLNIPILAQYQVAEGLKVKAGVQPGFLMSAKADGNDFKDACETFDLSIPLGLSYEISDFVIDARYNLGLTKTNKDGDSHKNSVIMLTVGYKIPF